MNRLTVSRALVEYGCVANLKVKVMMVVIEMIITWPVHRHRGIIQEDQGLWWQRTIGGRICAHWSTMGRAYIFAPGRNCNSISQTIIPMLGKNWFALTIHSSSLAMLATSSLAGITLIPCPLLLQHVAKVFRTLIISTPFPLFPIAKKQGNRWKKCKFYHVFKTT